MTEHAWPEAHRKRVREDDYADLTNGGTLGFTEHRSKRLQALPLRTSPNAKRWADPPTFPQPQQSFPVPGYPRTITPGASDSEDSNSMEPQQHIWAPEPELLPQQLSPSILVSDMADRDMDMMDMYDDTPPPSHMHMESDNQDGGGGGGGQQQQQQQQQNQDQDHLHPGPFHPDQAVANITGRMPTPIHCSFAQQVRGNSNWGGAAGNVMQSALMDSLPEQLNSPMGGFDGNGGNSLAGNSQQLTNMMDNGGHESSSSIPRSLDGATANAAQFISNWNMVQTRRLPSPISESGGEDGSSGSLESPRMVLDSSSSSSSFQSINNNSQNHHNHNLGRLTHQHPLLSTLPTRSSSAADGMDVESSPTTTTPSPKKGHARSKHTINSWTALQPGMKRSFSIGYRADCEKCRMKVPGHFNHIIIS
ncbi:hypothetical protein B0T17DRAFT_592373 [Bombardia bombarda]|uniref:Uncharacterized protein n=1 Tax=Bombardia bombarda TaxID=252184 RepID=A0AA39WHR6_9PEZI|nr:hypothetical protein B0T17DRAFT_592373 [Bombardia bombarda]